MSSPSVPSPQADDPFDGRHVHLLGIGGSGMNGLARIMLDRGARCSGADAQDSEVVEALRTTGIPVSTGQDP